MKGIRDGTMKDTSDGTMRGIGDGPRVTSMSDDSTVVKRLSRWLYLERLCATDVLQYSSAPSAPMASAYSC